MRLWEISWTLGSCTIGFRKGFDRPYTYSIQSHHPIHTPFNLINFFLRCMIRPIESENSRLPVDKFLAYFSSLAHFIESWSTVM